MEAPKKKRRYSDKRRQMSRDAARFRRSNEALIFAELHSALPCSSVPPQLDKASIVRIVISYLKLHRVVSDVLDINDRPVSLTALDYKFDHLYLKALDGFVMVITKDGEVIYISENVDSYLGLLQVDIVGHSIFDLTHPCDHDDVRDLISDKSRNHATASSTDGNDLRPHRELFIRMKSSLVSKGHFPTFKSSAYRVVHCCGHSVPVADGLGDSCVLLTGRLIPHPSFVDVQLDTQSFVSWHNMDMTFTYCDERICKLLGFNSRDLIGKSIYRYHHVLDGDMLEKSYKTLFAKGQMVTGPYRFLASFGGYAWLETQATIVNKSSTEKTQCVVCISNVISDVEEQDLVLSDVQLPTKCEIIERKADNSRCVSTLSSKFVVIEPKPTKIVKSEQAEEAEQVVIEDEYEEQIDICDDADDDAAVAEDANEDDDAEEMNNNDVAAADSTVHMDLSKMKFATEMIVKKFSRTISLACLTEEAVHNEIANHGPHGAAPATDFHSSLLEKLGKLQCVSNQQGSSSSSDSDTMTSSSSQDLHTIPSNNSLFTLLENLQQNEFEQRAPYISVDDISFIDDRDDFTITCSVSDNTEPSSSSSGVFFTSGDADDGYIDSSTTDSITPTPSTASHTPLGCHTPLAGHLPLYYTPAVMAACGGQNVPASSPGTPAPPYWPHGSSKSLQSSVSSSADVTSSGLHSSSSSSNSILMNLLVTGKDVNFGYRLDCTMGDPGNLSSELCRILCSKYP